MTYCPHCGGENTEFLGYDDGAGDYGEDICEVWFCEDCQVHFDEGLPMPDDDGDDSDFISGNPDLYDVSGGHDK